MIGKAIEKVMVQKKMTQSKLAEKSKVSKSYLSDLINGVFTNPTIEVIKAISKALAIKPQRLLTIEEELQKESEAENESNNTD